MPDAKKDTTGTAQARFVVSLPAEVGVQIDALGAKIAASLERETGVAFELTRAQIVQSLIRQAISDSDEVVAETEAE